LIIDFNEVMKQLFIMTFLIGIGYVVKKVGVLDSNGDKTISGLVVKVTSPFLILYSMSTVSGENVFKNGITMLLFAVGSISLAYALSRLILCIKGLSVDEKVISRLSIIFGNAAFLGFPLCYGLFGETGLFYASIYSAVQDVFLWTMGVGIVSREKNKISRLFNINLIAILAGIILLMTGIRFPDFIKDSLMVIGKTTIPLALIIVGSGFYAVKLTLKELKIILMPVILKLVLIPLIAVLALSLLNAESIVKYILLIELSMPCAASIVALCTNYGRDYKFASQTVMISTLISLISIPLWLFIFKITSFS